MAGAGHEQESGRTTAGGDHVGFGQRPNYEPRKERKGSKNLELIYQGSRRAHTDNPDDDATGNQQLDHDQDRDDDLLSEALLAVASAEEYTAKIIKLQQACLTPLKEDLADWLNKIMNTSSITTDNFMDKLDNGVIICRLAKIISKWCEQQLTNTAKGQIDLSHHSQQQQQQQHTHNRTSSQQKLDSIALRPNYSQSYASNLSISTSNFHSTSGNNDTIADVENYEPLYNRGNKHTPEPAIATPLRQPQPRSTLFANGGVPLRSSSQSTNCLTTSSMTSLSNGYLSCNHFLSNLVRMDQMKIWEDAKCRTFYARDNVCNFIRWSKDFGVNQSVLFESDDLVLHANPRQVVLCLLDVARIACVKHGFTEAPGLVKFEQEIDRELAAEKAALNRGKSSPDDVPLQSQSGLNHQLQNNEFSHARKFSSLAKNSRGGSIVDATDDLIMRYCIHKEETARKKQAAELEATKLKAAQAEEAQQAAAAIHADEIDSSMRPSSQPNGEATNVDINGGNEAIVIEKQLASTHDKEEDPEDSVMKSPSGGDITAHKHNLNYDNRVDSLDSGEGRTESASTSHTSRTPINLFRKNGTSAIPVPIKRSDSSSSLISNQTSSMETSDISSSRSSLLSGQESATAKRHIASDLDGKVMRIAKSYYGKGVTKGVTRLSEGKYKIADRIVFVRLLKGHRVMVRIGGGWDTLENFLFRHKSDPSQVIDVDNLLPLETKMTFEKSPQLTPTNNKFSKLPYYRHNSSASSTNLSISNLSVSNHSPTSSSSTSATNACISTPPQKGPDMSQRNQSTTTNKQIPYFLIHRNQNTKATPQSAYPEGPTNGHQRTPVSSSSRYSSKRPLGNSRTPTASTTNLYPATLTTRLASTNLKSLGAAKINFTSTNLHNGRTPKQEAFRKLGRSNDSLHASFYKSPLHRQHQQNGSSQNGNLSAKRKIDQQQRSTNTLVRPTNN